MRPPGAGVVALGLYGFVATLQSDANFGRFRAAWSLACGMVPDGYLPVASTFSVRSSAGSGWPPSCTRRVAADRPAQHPRWRLQGELVSVVREVQGGEVVHLKLGYMELDRRAPSCCSRS
jgi:hypothetical protein